MCGCFKRLSVLSYSTDRYDLKNDKSPVFEMVLELTVGAGPCACPAILSRKE